MLDKPYDFAVIIALSAMVIGMVGMGLNEIQQEDPTITNTTFFTEMNYMYEEPVNNTGLLQTSADVGGSLSEGDSGEQTDESFIVRAGKGLLKLGGSFTAFSEGVAVTEESIPGFPTGLVSMFVAMLFIIFAVTIIAWWRGKV